MCCNRTSVPTPLSLLCLSGSLPLPSFISLSYSSLSFFVSSHEEIGRRLSDRGVQTPTRTPTPLELNLASSPPRTAKADISGPTYAAPNSIETWDTLKEGYDIRLYVRTHLREIWRCFFILKYLPFLFPSPPRSSSPVPEPRHPSLSPSLGHLPRPTRTTQSKTSSSW